MQKGITITLRACDPARLKYFSHLLPASSQAVCVPATNTLKQNFKPCRRKRNRDNLCHLSGLLTELPPQRDCEEPIMIAQEAHRHQDCKRAHIPRT